jgi:hypothetical protein
MQEFLERQKNFIKYREYRISQKQLHRDLENDFHPQISENSRNMVRTNFEQRNIVSRFEKSRSA